VKQRPCLSAEALAEFIRGGGTDDEQRHVAECEACTRRVTLLRRIDAAGAGPIGDAAAEIDDLIGKLLAAPRGAWWKLVLEPEYRQADVARRLLNLAIDARLRDPRLAVDLTQAATAVADRLVAGHRTAELRFQAWRFASAVFREAGRYAATEAAIRSAEEAAKTSSDPELAQASMLLSRALLYAEPDVWKPEEAMALLDQAEEVFAQRDPARMQIAITTRAFLSFRSGDFGTARERFQVVLAATLKSDRESYLNALSNLMSARVELHDADSEVEEAAAFLLEENAALGRTVQVGRARWMMGRVLMLRGSYEEAVNLMRTAMVEIGDSDSAIRIGLDAIEALLLDGRHQEASALARKLASAAVTLEEREPSRRHGLTTQVFVYLREAAHRQAWTPDLVADVARYLDRITRQHPFDFIPPMPLAEM
jgi:tetratricopeptide (TPR) repeat protein